MFVAGGAHSMAVQNAKKITSLENQVTQGKETLMQTHALANQNMEQLQADREALVQTQVTVKHNTERLDADDRKRGYVTPRAQFEKPRKQ